MEEELIEEVEEESLSYETVDLPKKRYNLVTSIGSIFYLEFKPTLTRHRKDGVIELIGEMFLEGKANSNGKFLRFAGLGYLPEIGGDITVAPYELAEDGEIETREHELITEVQEINDELDD